LAELPGYLTDDQRQPDPVLTLAELDAAIGDFIADHYHHRTHPELGETPQQVWLGDGWLPRLPESVDELNLLLLRVAKHRIVRRDGVHFQDLRYVSPPLAAYVKEPVVIRFDPTRTARSNQPTYRRRSRPTQPSRSNPIKTCCQIAQEADTAHLL